MANYHAIVAIGEALKRLLEDARPPEFQNAQFQLYEAGNFGTPMDEGVSLYLYRVAVNMTRHNTPRVGLDGRNYRPALPVDLYYMLTPWAKEATMQHSLLGWAMRVVADTPIIPAGYLNQYNPQDQTFKPNETVELVPELLSLQDMYNIWNGFKTNMYPSVAYVARLVVIESSVAITEAGPVQTRDFDMRKAVVQ